MQNFLVFGFGMMGSSLCGLIKEAAIDSNIFASDLDKNNIDFGLREGIIDGIFDQNLDIHYDYVIIATPISSFDSVSEILSVNPSRYGVIFDIGSLNKFPYSVIHFKNFVSCHPICGNEKSGVSGYDPELFKGSNFYISKTDNKSHLEDKIASLVKSLKLNPLFIYPEEHDRIYGLVSHLPQFLSFLTKEACTDSLANILKPAFRLNNSSEAIWQDIFSLNGDNLKLYYEQFYDNIIDLYEDVELGNFESVYDTFQDAFSSLESSKIDVHKGVESEIVNTLFRLTIVVSFVNIEDIELFSKYAGSGFDDFVSILGLIDSIDKKDLFIYLRKGKNDLISLFNNTFL